jgi:hypothetical protein
METQDYSQWTNESIDQLVLSNSIDTENKIKELENYIKWKLSINNVSTYPLINLVACYYGLVESKTNEQINEIIHKNYGIEFVNSINNLTVENILSALTLSSFMYMIMK